MLDYLTEEQEMQVIDLTTTAKTAQVEAVTNAAEILEFHELVRMVPIADSVARYAVDLMRATRPSDPSAPDFVKKYVNFGASVRAAQFLVLAAKARSLMKRRYHVTYEDMRALAAPVLRHRILLNFFAESDRLKTDDILKRLLDYLPAPKGE
jgi:MoxR-like ATPase